MEIKIGIVAVLSLLVGFFGKLAIDNYKESEKENCKDYEKL